MRYRNHHVTFWLDEEEYKTYRKNVDKKGIGSGDYLRKLIMESQIEPRDPQKYQVLLDELTVIGNQINQIAHAVNARGLTTDADIEALKPLVWKMHDLVIEALK